MAKKAENARAVVDEAKAALAQQEAEAAALAEAQAIVDADDARIAEEARLAKRAELLDEFGRQAAVVVEKRDAAIERMVEYAQFARAAYEARIELDGKIPSILAYTVEGEDGPVRPASIRDLFANVGGGEEGAALQASIQARGISITDARLEF